MTPSTSSSGMSPSTESESWDSDPDLLLPDGPLTLIHSDTESSSLFSSHHNPINQAELHSSTSSSDCQQSTIRPNKESSQINQTVLSVLASGAKGTVTRLKPSKKPSPIQAGFDWDQDILLPEGGLRAVLRPSDTHVKKKSSFASAISDELEDLHLATRSAFSHANPPLANQTKSSVNQCATVDEEGADFDSDFELPPSSQPFHLSDLKNHLQTTDNRKPTSILSLDLDHLDKDPHDLPKSSASSRRGSVLRSGSAAISNSTSTSMSLSVANRSSMDDSNTPRIRTRPSLTPSLMSDRSSSSFPENEDDINDGFFDDIEFPPEFGIPNSLSAPPSSTHTLPTSPGVTPKPTQSPLPDPKGKQPNKSKSIDLQSYLNSKIQARALMVERNNSSYLSQQLRQNISTYEDRDDERVEDGLEIDHGSIHPANLRTRKTSSMSSTSSLAPQQSNRNSYFQQPLGHRFHHASSSNGSNLSQQSKSSRRVPNPSSRSTVIPNQPETRTDSPVPSTSSQILPRRQSSPQTTLLISRPHSVIPSTASNSSSQQHAPIQHRPISANGVILQDSASKNHVYSSFGSLSTSDSHPRLRTISCQSTASDGEPIKKTSSNHNSLAPSGRVQSPLGPSSLGINRSSTKTHPSSSLRARVSTTVASSHGPPVLSASNQRTLKHKKSAAAIKSNGSNISDLRSAYSSFNHNTSSIASPPVSMTSSSQRSLRRKQSMPSLNHAHHHSTGSAGLPGRFERAYQPPMSSSSIWKPNGVLRSKSKQQLFECSSSPSSPTLLTGSVIPSYADPTKASLNRHIANSSTVPPPNSNFPDRSISANSRRSSTESVRMNATSPIPPPPLTVSNAIPVASSRLTMPTIASRLKAKPSIIHEEQLNNYNNIKHWKAGGIIPQQLRRPKRVRNYGDGTELDEFDDLPTSKEKEKLFTRSVTNKGHQSTIKSSSKLGNFNQVQQNGPFIASSNNNEFIINQQQQKTNNKNRLEIRKAEGARRRALAINNSSHANKNSSKKGLIRQMSGNTLSKLSNNTEMRWNHLEARWEGNEHILREFDNALSTSSRPALISQLSIQSPMIRSQQQQITPSEENNRNEKRFSSGSFNHKINKAQNHVVGGMIFDSETMSWKKLSGDDDEDYLHLESDDELELRWLADDESSRKHKSNNNNIYYSNNGNPTSSWNSFSSGLSLNQNHRQDNLADLEEQQDNRNEDLQDINYHHQNKDKINRMEVGNKKNKIKRMTSDSFWKACLDAEERHKNEIKSWIPCDHTNNTTNGTTVRSKYAIGVHSYGRLTDSDRFYLQEIRKLVLDEEV